MKRKVAVITEDRFLLQKIKLTLPDCSVLHYSPENEGEKFDLILYDTRTTFSVPDGVRVVSIGADGDLPYPFEFEELKQAVSRERVEKFLLQIGQKCVYLRGECIKLTDVEFALFEELYSAGGEYVGRDELLSRVWGGKADGGVINVYIHYLRAKLERGEKIILSSRASGYKIDSRFIK